MAWGLFSLFLAQSKRPRAPRWLTSGRACGPARTSTSPTPPWGPPGTCRRRLCGSRRLHPHLHLYPRLHLQLRLLAWHRQQAPAAAVGVVAGVAAAAGVEKGGITSWPPRPWTCGPSVASCSCESRVSGSRGSARVSYASRKV